MNNVFVIFIFVMGAVFKIIDDVFDNTTKFPEKLVNNIDILQFILVSGMTLIVSYEPKITYLLAFTTISCFMSDSSLDFGNIDQRYWHICSLVVFMYVTYYWDTLISNF